MEKITVSRKKYKKLTVNRKSHYPIETLLTELLESDGTLVVWGVGVLFVLLSACRI